METPGIRMKVKITSSQQELEITILPEMTLSDVKSELCKLLNEEVEMKIIYRGKILKDSDDLSILQPNQQLYLVKEKKKVDVPPPTVPISSGAGNMAGMLHGLNHFGVMNQATSMLNELDGLQSENELPIDPNQMAMISQLMANPATRDMVFNSMQQMMSNPQMREMMINSNPGLKRLAESNPGMLDMMSNPMVMEQMKGMMQRMALGNTAGPLSGDTSSFPAPGGGSVAGGQPLPAGTNPPSSGANPMNSSSNPTNANPMNSGMNPMGGFNPMAANPMFSGMFNPYGASPTGNPMANPFLSMMSGMNNPPNPQANQPNPYMNMLNMFSNMNHGYPPPQNSFAPSPYSAPMSQPQNLRVVYAAQLASMKDMGFINEEANIRALEATGGNVNAAIERILNMLG